VTWIVRDMFHGFDYARGLTGTPQERLAVVAGAIEWVLAIQQRDAEKGTTQEGNLLGSEVKAQALRDHCTFYIAAALTSR
jgi:hypothetical protein